MKKRTFEEKQIALAEYKAKNATFEAEKLTKDKQFRTSTFFKYSFIFRLFYCLLFVFIAMFHYKEVGKKSIRLLESKTTRFNNKSGEEKTDFYLKTEKQTYAFSLDKFHSNYFENCDSVWINTNYFGKATTLQSPKSGPGMYLFSSHFGHFTFFSLAILSFFFRYGHEKISKRMIGFTLFTLLVSLSWYFLSE